MLLKFAKIVKKLSSVNENKRIEAATELSSIPQGNLTFDHLEYLIRAAVDVYQDNDFYDNDSSKVLMEFVSNFDLTDNLHLLAETFPKVSIWSRSVILTLLTRINSEKSLEMVLYLLERHIDQVPITDFFIELTGKEKESTDILFPELLDYIDYPNISYSVNRYVWSCLENETLIKEDVVDYTSTYVLEFEKFKKNVFQYEGNWDKKTIWETPYQELRNQIGLLLDIFGYLEVSKVLPLLEEALNFKDNRLRFFAVSSLLRFGISVEQRVIDEVAADMEMRNFLFKTLKDYNRTNKFPREHLNQHAFAESEMISWLIYPTELGHMPSEIECMEVITRYDEYLGAIDYYVFRFKSDEPEWEDNGWMAGISGYYIKENYPTSVANGYTFSAFESWDSMTAKEHLERAFELIDTAWDIENN